VVAAAPQVAKHKSKEEEKTQKKEAVKAVKNAPAKVEAKPAKKGKKDKDPAIAGIKGPLSAYLIFSNKRRPIIQ
jgi:hypothetical protein